MARQAEARTVHGKSPWTRDTVIRTALTDPKPIALGAGHGDKRSPRLFGE